jgi:hypothetical protein
MIKRHRVFSFTLSFALFFLMGIAVASWVSETWNNAPGKVKTGPVISVIGSASLCSDAQADGFPTLSPGETRGMCFRLTNNAGVDVHITDAAANPGVTVSNGGCDPSNFTLNDVHGISVLVPNGSDQIVSVPGLITLSPTAPIACANIYATAVFLLTAS